MYQPSFNLLSREINSIGSDHLSPAMQASQNALWVISMPETAFPHLSEPSFEAAWSFRTSCVSFRQSHPAGPRLPNVASLIGGAAAAEFSRRVVLRDQVEESRQWSIIFNIFRSISIKGARYFRDCISRLITPAPLPSCCKQRSSCRPTGD